MTIEHADVLVVGAGKAGDQLVSSLRDEGFAGSIAMFGSETAAAYDRPLLSKGYLTGTHSIGELLLRPSGFYEEQGIALETGRTVMAADPANRSVVLDDGRRLGYGDLVLATGASLRPLRLPGAELDGVTGLRDIVDAERIRDALSAARSVVVIGGGFVGLEVAAVAAWTFGLRVTVLESLPRLLSRSALPETAEAVLGYHRGLGVDVRLGAQVAAVVDDGSGRAAGVRLVDGERIPADLVVYGVGVDPRIGLAVEAGLEVGNGVLVDASLASAAPHVWAIGDCAAYPSIHFGGVVRLESIQNATDQARFLAAELTSGERGEYRALPWFWSDQAELVVQSVGLLGSRDASVTVGDRASGSFSQLAFRDGLVIGGDSVNARGDHLALRRLFARESEDWRRELTPERCARDGFALKQFAREGIAA